LIERREHTNLDICKLINDICNVFGVFYRGSKQYKDKKNKPVEKELLSAMLDTLKEINKTVIMFNESDLINAVPSLYKYRVKMVGLHMPSNARFIKMPYLDYFGKMMDEEGEPIKAEVKKGDKDTFLDDLDEIERKKSWRSKIIEDES
jgi:hypothetical protein